VRFQKKFRIFKKSNASTAGQGECGRMPEVGADARLNGIEIVAGSDLVEQKVGVVLSSFVSR
jgi:hypothetical protein